MTENNAIIAVFARNPEPGRVKTRLQPTLTTEEVITVYKGLVQQTLQTTVSTDYSINLYCTPDIDDPFMQDCAARFCVSLQTQVGNNLGERMYNAITDALQHTNVAIVVGCDCPQLSQDDLHRARDMIMQGKDVVLGPAKDGGYYLIAMSHPQKELFEGVEWGTDSVLQETRKKIRQLKLNSYELAEKSDVDRPEDLYLIN